MRRKRKIKAVLLQKIIALPAIILDEVIDFVKRIYKDEKRIK